MDQPRPSVSQVIDTFPMQLVEGVADDKDVKNMLIDQPK